MLEPGAWVSVALPKGQRRAQLVEVQGERCLCSFDDGKKAWVATSVVTSLGSRSAAPSPSRAPTSPVQASLQGSPTSSPSRMWAVLAIVTLSLVAVGVTTFTVLKRRTPPAPVAPEVRVAPDETPERLRPVVSGLALPFTDYGVALEERPNVLIDRRAIYVESEQVADLEPLLRTSKPERVDAVFHRLKAARQAWDTAHPGAQYPGSVQLWVDGETSALVVKSVFQTAAFAGHPNGGFVLRRRDAPLRLEQSHIEAHLPAPPDSQQRRRPVRVLGVALRADDYVELAWLGAALEPPVERTVPLAALGPSIVELWNRRPAGVDVTPQRGEQAALSVPNSAPFRKVAQVLDGLAAARVKRAATSPREVPVFDVNLRVSVADSARDLADDLLSPDIESPHVDESITPRIDREATERVFKRSRGKLSACYRLALVTSPTLAGKIRLRLVIEPNGRVSRADVAPDSPIRNAEFERCALTHLKSLDYPQPTGGRATAVFPTVLVKDGP